MGGLLHIKSAVFLLLFSLTTLVAEAQKPRVAFHSVNSYVFLIGEHGTDWGLETVNGVAYQQFFTGIGLGFDHYRFKSYPLFFDQRIFFGEKKKLFAYGDLGYNFSGKNQPGPDIYYYKSYHFQGGVFAGGGMGVNIKIDRKLFFTLSAGFSYKEIRDQIDNSSGPCQGGSCPVDISTYNYSYGRWALKAGVDF